MERRDRKACEKRKTAEAPACYYSGQYVQTPFYPAPYMGRWYEISRFPQWFDEGCAAATADYALQPDGTISVFNRCLNCLGREVRNIRGTAAPVNERCPAALRVEFPGAPMETPAELANYLVLGTDYESYAVVGTPGRLGLFILGRSPSMGPATYRKALEIAKTRGYDTAKLVKDYSGC